MTKHFGTIVRMRLLTASFLLAAAISAYSLHAAPSSRTLNDETGTVADSLRYQYSESTKPVEFSIDDVYYRVPRNFIIQMDDWNGGPQTLVEFRVTFPGLAPRSTDTLTCLDGPISFSGAKCARQDCFVTKGYPSSDVQEFENFRVLFTNQTPERGPDGFERHDTGPASARDVTFRKRVRDEWLIFRCHHMSAVHDFDTKSIERSVCTPHHKFPNGNELGYHFYEGQLPIIAEKDQGIIELIRRFQIRKEQ